MNTLTRSESMNTNEQSEGTMQCVMHGAVQGDWEEYIQKYEKKKILVPPMNYDLQFVSANKVYCHIADLTKNDLGATNYLAQIKPDLDDFFCRQKPVVFGYIPAPPHTDITRQVIGLKGYFFKMTTVCCGVYFIWHDTSNNAFLFWGPSKFKVVKAMNSIRWRIFKLYEQSAAIARTRERSSAPEPISEDEEEDYADMPKLISMGREPEYEHPEPC